MNRQAWQGQDIDRNSRPPPGRPPSAATLRGGRDCCVTTAETGRRAFHASASRLPLVCHHWRANPERYRDYAFFPTMPYAHKYANAMTDYGMLGAIKRFLPDEGFLDAAMRGGMSLAKKDIEGITTLLVDAEMKMFAGLRGWLANLARQSYTARTRRNSSRS